MTIIDRVSDKLFDVLRLAVLYLTAGGFFLLGLMQLSDPRPGPTEGLLLIFARQIYDLRKALAQRAARISLSGW